MLDNIANTDTSAKEQSPDSDSIIPCKPTGFLIYIPATSPDSSTMVEHMCTLALSRQQVTIYQQRVNHGSMQFPLPPYSALQLTLPKSTAFSDDCQPRVDNESAFSVIIPDQPLNRADPQQQVNGSWQGNVHGNSKPMSAPAIHAATNGTASPYPSTTSPCQPLSPTSPTQPSQPPQQGQSAQLIGTGSTTILRRHVPCTYPNCENNRNKGIEKRHICHYSGCGKAFVKPYQLQNHLRQHSGEKPFICNWLSCGKRFMSFRVLQQHRHTHTSEKKYVCKVCSKKFKWRSSMMRHANKCIKETRQV